MQVIGLLKQKGGAGASTIAVHLALCAMRAKRKVVLIDLDPQGSALAWSAARGDQEPPVVQAGIEKLSAVLTAAEQDGYTLAILDTPPRNDAVLAAAARASTVCLIPTKVSPFDLAAVPAIAGIVTSTGTPAWLILNEVPREGTEAPDAREALSALGVPIWDGQIGHRKAFRHTVSRGRTVFDPPDRRDWRGLDGAQEEISALWKHVVQHLGKR